MRQPGGDAKSWVWGTGRGRGGGMNGAVRQSTDRIARHGGMPTARTDRSRWLSEVSTPRRPAKTPSVGREAIKTGRSMNGRSAVRGWAPMCPRGPGSRTTALPNTHRARRPGRRISDSGRCGLASSRVRTPGGSLLRTLRSFVESDGGQVAGQSATSVCDHSGSPRRPRPTLREYSRSGWSSSRSPGGRGPDPREEANCAVLTPTS